MSWPVCGRVMQRWWSLFWEAVRGSDRDYTAGPVGPALVMLSVPMVLEMAMESLFAVVDVFFVSRISGDAVSWTLRAPPGPHLRNAPVAWQVSAGGRA